jgi:hypothetical protein
MQTSYEESNSMTHIKQLLGHDERCNDVIYAPKLEDCQPTTDHVVVFFGGDVQVSA